MTLVYVNQVLVPFRLCASKDQKSPIPAPCSVDHVMDEEVEVRSQVRLQLECARLHAGISVAELSRATQISEGLLQKFERGTDFPRAYHLTLLQAHLKTVLSIA